MTELRELLLSVGVLGHSFMETEEELDEFLAGFPDPLSAASRLKELMDEFIADWFVTDDISGEIDISNRLNTYIINHKRKELRK